MRTECDDPQRGAVGADVVGRRAVVKADCGAGEHSDVERVVGGGERIVRFAPLPRDGRRVRVRGALQRECRALVNVQRCNA